MPYNLYKIKTFCCLLTYLLILVLAGCTIKFGKPFDPEKFQTWVKRGSTTQTEVRNFLGAPQSTGRMTENDGTEYLRWLYYHGNGKLTQMDQATFKTLEIRFDDTQTVVSYSWSG